MQEHFTQCDCDECVSMCRSFPCKGTVAEIALIIEKGHGSKLMLHTQVCQKSGLETTLLMPAKLGFAGIEYWLTFSMSAKPCMFLNDCCHCEIHDIKPTEGKFADCKRGTKTGLSGRMYAHKYEEMKAQLFADWQTPEGKALIAKWQAEFKQGAYVKCQQNQLL